MPSNNETKPEKREAHPVELHPKKDNSALINQIGKKAVQGASKDKPKK